MSPEVQKNETPLYWLGKKLIEKRFPVMIAVFIVTAFFAYHTFELYRAGFVTSFSDLLPQTHPFMKVHNQYAGTFGGANNVVIMVENEGGLFNVDTLTRIYRMTEELDKVYGVNHAQIDSIGHRTTRSLKVAAGGLMNAEPVMIGPPKTEEKAAEIRERVATPFTTAWIGVAYESKDEAGVYPPPTINLVMPGSPAVGKLNLGDTITAVDGKPVANRFEVAKAVSLHKTGETVKSPITQKCKK